MLIFVEDDIIDRSLEHDALANSNYVRQRPVLVPDDPSYPRVQNNRFARVGEALEKRRVGVVDSNGHNLQWLSIESPDEVFLSRTSRVGGELRRALR